MSAVSSASVAGENAAGRKNLVWLPSVPFVLDLDDAR